jgi:hypothetical protein
MKKLNKLNLIPITIIQIIIATVISLIFQFIIPLNWQPLDVYTMGPDVQHGTPGANIVIFAVSQWYFSVSIAWFLKRDNKYINNFLAYALIPLILIIISEFFTLHLYYDYIHLIPFLVSLFILFKKKYTLFPKYVIYYIAFLGPWTIIDYIFKLAYYDVALPEFIFNAIIFFVLTIILSIIIAIIKKFRTNSKDQI